VRRDAVPGRAQAVALGLINSLFDYADLSG
jgi:hypothetical protein